MAARMSLGELAGTGSRAAGRYTGTLLAVFLVQSFVAAACLGAIAVVLAQVFAHLPMWDDAVDGDLVALITCIRFAKAQLVACAGIVGGGVLLWQLASWFLIGGINGVLFQRPEGRADTARCFGASGTATYLGYARLALCALPGWMVVMFVFGMCAGIASDRIANALTIPELLAPLALAILPALALLHVLQTIGDYARVELTLRHETHEPSAVITYLRAMAFVLKHPVTLLHAGLGWLLFAMVTIGYAYLAHGHPMYGAEGAVTLFVIRQGVALGRSAIRFGVLSGQVELGRTRPLALRRLPTKSDAKKT